MSLLGLLLPSSHLERINEILVGFLVAGLIHGQFYCDVRPNFLFNAFVERFERLGTLQGLLPNKVKGLSGRLRLGVLSLRQKLSANASLRP